MPTISLSYIDSVVCGDDDMRRELLAIFLEQAAALAPDLEQALARADFDTMARAAHSFRSTARSFGLDDVADALKKIEIIGKKLYVRSPDFDTGRGSLSTTAALYLSQINGLTPELDSWTDANISPESVQQLIEFCKLHLRTASDEVAAILH